MFPNLAGEDDQRAVQGRINLAEHGRPQRIAFAIVQLDGGNAVGEMVVNEIGHGPVLLDTRRRHAGQLNQFGVADMDPADRLHGRYAEPLVRLLEANKSRIF